MRQIRQSVFETNSSSTHSICICTREEYDKWTNNELIYNSYSEQLEPIPEDASNKYKYQTYEEYCDNYDFEHYNEFFISPSGDKMVAFGVYGYDG